MRINYNMNSLDVHRNYKKALGLQSTALERITSGLKINGAKDNPVKLGQCEQMRMNIRGLHMAERNIQDNVSMLQTNDGALDSIGNALVRMKELTVQASNGSMSQGDLEAIQNEIDQLKDHIDYTAKNTEFNGVNIIGSGNGADIDSFKTINSTVGTNPGDMVKIPVFNVSTNMLVDEKGNSVKDINVLDPESSDTSLNVLDKSISQISAIRSKYGSLANRLETSAENLSTNVDTITGAESNLRDADIAEEMMEYTRTEILSQTGIALMAQTNEFPNDILRVLEKLSR